MTTLRCQRHDEDGQQCRLYFGHRAKCVFVGEILSLTLSLAMQEEARIAYAAGQLSVKLSKSLTDREAKSALSWNSMLDYFKKRP